MSQQFWIFSGNGLDGGARFAFSNLMARPLTFRVDGGLTSLEKVRVTPEANKGGKPKREGVA
jgi:hypothetical protein